MSLTGLRVESKGGRGLTAEVTLNPKGLEFYRNLTRDGLQVSFSRTEIANPWGVSKAWWLKASA